MERIIDQLAGRLGVDPGPFTLRALIRMDEARRSDCWDHTASVMALLANCHRSSKQKAVTPADFHPLAPKPQPLVIPVTALRGLVLGHGGPPPAAAPPDPQPTPEPRPA